VAFNVPLCLGYSMSNLTYASNSTHINSHQIFSSVWRSVASQSRYVWVCRDWCCTNY